MVQARRKAAGRQGRPKAGTTRRHVRVRRSLPPGGVPVTPHVLRVRDRPDRRPGRIRIVHPGDEWRPMRRVSGVAWQEQHKAGPERVRREDEATDARFAEQPRRRGRRERLLEFQESRRADRPE